MGSGNTNALYATQHESAFSNSATCDNACVEKVKLEIKPLIKVFNKELKRDELGGTYGLLWNYLL